MNNTSLCMWPEKAQRCDTVLLLQRIFSAVSLLGCIFIIALIWLFKTYKYFVQRLILCLSVAAGFQSLVFLISNLHNSDGVCQFQAVMLQYFGWSTLLWVVCMTINIILVVRGFSNTSKFEKWYHVLSWILPIFWSGLPFIGHQYGSAGVWCWIKRDATLFRFGTWYVPVYVLILFLAFAYLYVFVKVLKQSGRWSGTYNAQTQHDNVMLVKEVKPLAAFPLIYLLMTIPTTIYRIDDAVHPQQLPSYVLLIVSSICNPLVGCLNAIAFAFYGEIHALLKWSKIKSAWKSRFAASTTNVTHNYDVSENLPEQASYESFCDEN